MADREPWFALSDNQLVPLGEHEDFNAADEAADRLEHGAAWIFGLETAQKWSQSLAAALAERPVPMAVEGETVVRLADGCTLRSGSDELQSGDYVRLCEPDGTEYAYWHNDEWRRDPVLVMGAIINCAAGVRLTEKKER